MKMKNKVLGILVTLIIMIGVMASQVNAATISASSTEVNVGDTVTVTVSLEDATQSIGLDLTYNADNFEYVAKSATSGLDSLTVNDREAGVVKIAGADPYNSTTYVTFTFVAKANTDAAEFVASGLYTQSQEALDVSSVSVAVVEKAEEPTNPEDPTNPEQPENPGTDVPSDTENNTQAGNGANTDAPKVDENGNVITKLPQTGVTVFQVAGVVAVVAIVAVVAVRKLRK